MPSRINKLAVESIPFDHILINGFIDPVWVAQQENLYLSQLKIILDHGNLLTTNDHPATDIIQDKRTAIIDAVNNTWELDIKSLIISTSVMLSEHAINTHNDHHTRNIPVRGLLYLNKFKKYGTHLHTNELDNNPVEVGGYAGQLLLMRISDRSHHSVGIHSVEDNRIVLNLMFYKELL